MYQQMEKLVYQHKWHHEDSFPILYHSSVRIYYLSPIVGGLDLDSFSIIVFWWIVKRRALIYILLSAGMCVYLTD